MKKINPDLWQSKVFHPFPYLKTQCYFLKTKPGNVLVYNTGHEEEWDFIEEQGGILCQYLSHRHESGANLTSIRQRFDSKLICESVEAAEIDKDCGVDLKISGDMQFENGVAAIVTPGHTEGGCCYYYESSSDDRYLFTGDLFFVDGDRLSTFVYSPDGGSNAELIKSLESLRQFNPTLVLSSAFGGEHSALSVTFDFWQEEIDRNITQLR